ncbi:hypothetical protein BKA70DRAFT_1309739 [Coprinopsis sp. MPI-PUGE-AT-0042]|nr:hypothetical protein BKA70DRAFT_350600 [Coprinopsis sp. MPI-PUGE-AT-0042]KAH6901195.1 hypothetical protein BKA70DRAFT_1309739 [Coprinopsis sp. MPI-PUGE-AT-0042]
MKVTTLAALLVPTLAVRVGFATAFANFSQSCYSNNTGIVLANPEGSSPHLMLYAGCFSRTQGLTWSLVDLCPCLGFKNNTLQVVAGSGHLILDGCNGCKLVDTSDMDNDAGTIMECECAGEAKTIDLDTFVGLDNEARLTCYEPSSAVLLSPSFKGIFAFLSTIYTFVA